MAEGHIRHWQKKRETFKLSNQKTVRYISRERAKKSPARPRFDLSNDIEQIMNILLKKGKEDKESSPGHVQMNVPVQSAGILIIKDFIKQVNKKWNCF